MLNLVTAPTSTSGLRFLYCLGFALFWSIVFIVSSTLIFIFKKDNSLDITEDHGESRLGLKESYIRLWQIVKIGPVQQLCFLLLTYQLSIIFDDSYTRNLHFLYYPYFLHLDFFIIAGWSGTSEWSSALQANRRRSTKR